MHNLIFLPAARNYLKKIKDQILKNLFKDVCNDTEVEAICKQIKSKFTDLPSDFVSWVVAKCLSAPLDSVSSIENFSTIIKFRKSYWF